MTSPVFAAFFLGQVGWAFSSAFGSIASVARERGIGAWVYDYGEIDRARADIGALHGLSKIALVGYSLGCTAATYLQTQMRVDLVVSVAASTLGENHRINRVNTKRSVLYRGTDFLSSAGLHDGYDEVVNVTAGWSIPIFSHLLIPANPIVIDGILAELAKLKGT
jgi:hypothetical protein